LLSSIVEASHCEFFSWDHELVLIFLFRWLYGHLLLYRDRI
jgi:hypothetical protein